MVTSTFMSAMKTLLESVKNDMNTRNTTIQMIGQYDEVVICNCAAVFSFTDIQHCCVIVFKWLVNCDCNATALRQPCDADDIHLSQCCRRGVAAEVNPVQLQFVPSQKRRRAITASQAQRSCVAVAIDKPPLLAFKKVKIGPNFDRLQNLRT